MSDKETDWSVRRASERPIECSDEIATEATSGKKHDGHHGIKAGCRSQPRKARSLALLPRPFSYV